jgi:DNA-binding protein H-NS
MTDEIEVIEVDLDVQSVTALIDLKERVEANIAAKAHDEIRDIDAKIKALTETREKLIAQYGTPKKVKKPKSAVVSLPKYRHPVTGQTWTGRGKTPAWLIEARDALSEEQLLVAYKP